MQEVQVDESVQYSHGLGQTVHKLFEVFSYFPSGQFSKHYDPSRYFPATHEVHRVSLVQ